MVGTAAESLTNISIHTVAIVIFACSSGSTVTSELQDGGHRSSSSYPFSVSAVQVCRICSPPCSNAQTLYEVPMLWIRNGNASFRQSGPHSWLSSCFYHFLTSYGRLKTDVYMPLGLVSARIAKERHIRRCLPSLPRQRFVNRLRNPR